MNSNKGPDIAVFSRLFILKLIFYAGWHAYRTIGTSVKVFFIATIVFFFASLTSAQGVTAAFDIDEIIKAIKQQVQAAQATETGLPRLKIDRIEIELETVAETEGTGGIKIKVANLGAQLTAGLSQGTTQTLRLVLVPVVTPQIGTIPDLGLVTAIQSVKNALRNALNEPPPFKLDTFKFKIHFALERKANGGLSFLIIDLANIKSRNLATHKIVIYMSLA